MWWAIFYGVIYVMSVLREASVLSCGIHSEMIAKDLNLWERVEVDGVDG